MRDTVKFDPSIPDRQVTGESSASAHTCSSVGSASQTEYLDVQSVSSASSYMALPSLKHGPRHVPLSSLGPPGLSTRRSGCAHSCRCEEESIMQNICNKRNERLNKPCKDGFCYCFASDSDDFRKGTDGAATTSGGHPRCKALRKEYAYNLPTESDCSEIISSDQYFADKEKEKKKKRVSLPPEVLEASSKKENGKPADCSHKDGKCSSDHCRRRTFHATNRFQEFHCSDSDAPLIHIVQEVQRNMVVSEIRINRSKLKKSKVRSKSAGRTGGSGGTGDADVGPSAKIVNGDHPERSGERNIPEKLSDKTDRKDIGRHTQTKFDGFSNLNNTLISPPTKIITQSEDSDARSDLSSAKPRTHKSKGGRLLLKRIGPDASYKPSLGPPRKPPRNFSSSSDCSSLASERIKSSKHDKKKVRLQDTSMVSYGDQPTMIANFPLPQGTDESLNLKDSYKQVPNNPLNRNVNQKPDITKETFEKLRAQAESGGHRISFSSSEGYTLPPLEVLNIPNESFETGPSSRHEVTPTCPPYSEVASPNTTDINELLNMLPHVPTSPVLINESMNKLNNKSGPYPTNMLQAEINFVPVGEIPNPEQVGWVPPTVYKMLSTEAATEKFVSQHPLAEPQQVGWQPPPKLQIDTVDGGQKVLEGENSHNLAANMELKSTPVKPDIPKNDMTPKEMIREKAKNLPQPPAKPVRQNPISKVPTIVEMSHSGGDDSMIAPTKQLPAEPTEKVVRPRDEPPPVPKQNAPAVKTSNSKDVIPAPETVSTDSKDATSTTSTAAPTPATKQGKSFQKRALKHTKSFLESLGFKKKDGKASKEAKEAPKAVETVATQTNDSSVLQGRRLNFDYASDDAVSRRSMTPIGERRAVADAMPAHHSDDGFDFSRTVQSPKNDKKPFSPINFLKTLQPGTEKEVHDSSYKSYASDISEDFTNAVQDLLGKARAKLEGETTSPIAETVTNTLTDESVAACTISAQADIHNEPIYAEIGENGQPQVISTSKEVDRHDADKDDAVYAKVAKKGRVQHPLSPHRPAPLPPPANVTAKDFKSSQSESSEGHHASTTGKKADGMERQSDKGATAGGSRVTSPQPRSSTQQADSRQELPSAIRRRSSTDQPKHVRFPTPPHQSPSSSPGSSDGSATGRTFSPHLDEFFSHGPLQEVVSEPIEDSPARTAPRKSDSSTDEKSKNTAPVGFRYDSLYTSQEPNTVRLDRQSPTERTRDSSNDKPSKSDGGTTKQTSRVGVQEENRLRGQQHPSVAAHQVDSDRPTAQHSGTSRDIYQRESGDDDHLRIDPRMQNVRRTPRSSPQGQSSPDQDNFQEVYGSAQLGDSLVAGSQSFYSISSDRYATPVGWHQSQPIPGQRQSQAQIVQQAAAEERRRPQAASGENNNQGGTAAVSHPSRQSAQEIERQSPDTQNRHPKSQLSTVSEEQERGRRLSPQGWHQSQPIEGQLQNTARSAPTTSHQGTMSRVPAQSIVTPAPRNLQQQEPTWFSVVDDDQRIQENLPSVPERRQIDETTTTAHQRKRRSVNIPPSDSQQVAPVNLPTKTVQPARKSSGSAQQTHHHLKDGSAQAQRPQPAPSHYTTAQQFRPSGGSSSDSAEDRRKHRGYHSKAQTLARTADQHARPSTPQTSSAAQDWDTLDLPSPPHNITMGNPPVIEYALPRSADPQPHSAAIPSTSHASVDDQRRSIESDRPLTSSTPQPPAIAEAGPSTSFNNSHEKDSPPRARELSKSDLSQTSDIFLENLHQKNVNVTRRSDRSDRSDDEKRSNLDSPVYLANFYYYDSSNGNGDSTNSSFCREPNERRGQTSDDADYGDPCCGENCPHLKPIGYDAVDYENQSPETASYKSCRSDQDQDENMNNSTSVDLNLTGDNQSENKYDLLKHKLRASFRKGKNFFRKKRLGLVIDRNTRSDNDTRSREPTELLEDRKIESDFEVDYRSALGILSEAAKNGSVKCQLKQTVSICRQLPEFETSPEMVEAERLLLYSMLKEKSAFLSNESLSSSYQSTPKDFISGSICVTSFEIPIKPDIHHDDFFNYFYIGVFSRGQDIRSTQSAEKVDHAVFFSNCNMLFTNLKSDFDVNVDLYALRLRKLSSPPIHEGNVPIKIRKSSLSDSQEEVISRFNMHGSFLIRATDLAPFEVETNPEDIAHNTEFHLVSNNIFALPINLNARNINLTNEVWLTASAAYRFKNFNLNGFLNVGETNEQLNWNKRWCQIDALTLYFWNYPQDSSAVAPIMSINLAQCISSPIKSASREICPRPRSFQLEIIASSSEGTDASDTELVLLSAESQDEFIYWVRGLNEVVEFSRTWKVQVQ